ncbi:hypothetical protein JVU11DRAFT_8582 [Chiua virens]|nr:hypothetical protein JVU11DRAFT_8582 [Chiua virens]
MYHQVFRNYNFIINPSDLPGMDFSTRTMTSNHYVHFSFRDGRLQIKAQGDDGEILDLVPHGTLEPDLPLMLVAGHVHWLNVATSILEIRPLSRIWERSADNWRMHHMSGNCYRITRGFQSLVDIRSATWAIVSHPLKRLEIPENLIVMVSESLIHGAPSSPAPSLQISVSLPRYGLSFFVNRNHELESNDFKNMVFDKNQSIGTLIGLVNRLVLCPSVQIEEDLTPRCVLIREGKPRLEGSGNQTYVTINDDDEVKGETRRPKNSETSQAPPPPIVYHTYKVDTELGCLTGITDQASRLYLARLHAMTSNACRLDPLTGRTGLEEAISLVWSTRLCDSKQLFHSESALGHHVQELKDELGMIGSPQLRFPFEVSKIKTSVDAMLHEECLFPPAVASWIQVPGKYDKNLVQCRYVDPKSVNTEDFAYVIALAVWHWSFDVPGTNDIPNWVETWGDSESVSGDTSSSEELIEVIQRVKKDIYGLFEGSKLVEDEFFWRFHLLFSLPPKLADHLHQ